MLLTRQQRRTVPTLQVLLYAQKHVWAEYRLTDLGVELVVAQVERRVDGLERLEIQVHPLLLTLVRYDRPAVDHQAVRGHSRVESDTHKQNNGMSLRYLPSEAVSHAAAVSTSRW